MSAGDQNNSCHRKGKIITTAIVFLLLGAIVNVAVAWGCAALVVPRPQAPCAGKIQINTGAAPAVAWLSIDRACNVGVQRHLLGSSGWSSTQHEAVVVLENWLGSQSPVEVGLPSWSRLGVADVGGSLISTELEAASGWPFLAMYSALLEKHSDLSPTSRWRDVFDTRSAIVIKRGTVSDPLVDLRALPLEPIWPGFAINTVFYAVMLCALVAVPFALRRKRRVKRGLCPKCAYPVGISDRCTECGATTVTPRRGDGM